MLGGRWEGVGRALGGRWEGVGRALGGRWEGVGRALGGRWEGVGRALGGRWRVVRARPGSLMYRQIKSLHCSGYLLVYIILLYSNIYIDLEVNQLGGLGRVAAIQGCRWAVEG